MLITAGCNPCKGKLFQMELAPLPQTVHTVKMNLKVLQIFYRCQHFLNTLWVIFRDKSSQETMEGISSTVLADLLSLRGISLIRISICPSFDKSIFWGGTPFNFFYHHNLHLSITQPTAAEHSKNPHTSAPLAQTAFYFHEPNARPVSQWRCGI